jgi:hypothetical protein
MAPIEGNSPVSCIALLGGTFAIPCGQRRTAFARTSMGGWLSLGRSAVRACVDEQATGQFAAVRCMLAYWNATMATNRTASRFPKVSDMPSTPQSAVSRRRFVQATITTTVPGLLMAQTLPAAADNAETNAAKPRRLNVVCVGGQPGDVDQPLPPGFQSSGVFFS